MMNLGYYATVMGYLVRQRVSVIFEYRANLLMWILSSFVSLLFLISVWASLRPHEFQTVLWQFYIVAGFIGAFTSDGFYRRMSSDISSGQLSFYLLQKFPYMGRMVAGVISSSVVSLIITTGALMILSVFIRGTVALNFVNLLLAIPLLIMGRYISILLSLLFGCISFVWINPDPLYLVFDIVLSFLYGGMLPFWLLPPGIRELLMVLPFSTVVSLPAQVAMGISDSFGLGLLSGLVWMVILTVMAKLIWAKVLVYYEAVGG